MLIIIAVLLFARTCHQLNSTNSEDCTWQPLEIWVLHTNPSDQNSRSITSATLYEAPDSKSNSSAAAHVKFHRACKWGMENYYPPL